MQTTRSTKTSSRFESRGPAQWSALGPYALTLAAVGLTLAAVGLLELTGVIDLAATTLLYLVPVVLAASRWGRGPAIFAVAISILGHDWLFVDPRGSPVIPRLNEALALVLLLFTGLTTAQLADGARRRAEAMREAALVRQSDEMKTALLRAVTHDLRTPLASIKTSVSGLREPGVTYADADRAELLTEIEEETDRLTRLVANLLDASRIDAGRITPHLQPQDVDELISVAVDHLRRTFGVRIVSVDVSPDLPPAACDWTQMNQVLTNLLDNAARHTPDGTPISVRASLVNAMIRIDVRDAGPGIPPTERERLFEPFERGQTHGSGTGLGLAIARGWVEVHGGRLWLEANPGGGSCFALTLPIWVDPC